MREGAGEGEGREREKTGVGTSTAMGKARLPRGGGRGQGTRQVTGGMWWCHHQRGTIAAASSWSGGHGSA